MSQVQIDRLIKRALEVLRDDTLNSLSEVELTDGTVRVRLVRRTIPPYTEGDFDVKVSSFEV